jgi:hypothetical protein
MSTSTDERVASRGMVHEVVRVVSVGAGEAGGRPSQLPGSEAPASPGILTTTVVTVAHEHCAGASESSPAGLVLTFAAPGAGRGASEFRIGWVAGRGSAGSATITETVCW